MEGGDAQDVFSVCVADLVLETREFSLVLGQVLPDGSRRPGAVDKFLSDSSELTGFVAGQAEAQGLHEDAVRLYDLCKVGWRALFRVWTGVCVCVCVLCRIMGRCWVC